MMRNRNFGLLGYLVLLLAFNFGSPALAADTTSVAMITDLQGKAVLADDARKPGLSILSEIKLNSHVQFNANSRAVLVYLQSGQEFEITGPATVVFGPQEPVGTQGNKPAKRGVALAKSGKDIRIKPVVVAQAAIVMRSVSPSLKIHLLSPNGSMSLSSHPLFQWQPLHPDIAYQFELLDDTGQSLFSGETSRPQLQLPETVNLKENVSYTWMVSATLPDGKQFSNAGDFTIASENLRNEVRQLQPADDAALSELVVFATWLEQMQLRDEARKYWKVAAALRKDDQRLKVLAGE